MEAQIDLYSGALMAAGAIGAGVAVVHGILMHRLMTRPILDGMDLPLSTQRLLPLLLQFSTACWFLGGVALIATPVLAPATTLTTAVFVGGFYLFGAAGNLFGTQGRHPGWVLLAIASGLIVFGASGLGT